MVTLEGIVICVRPEQSQKASSPMSVTLEGMGTQVKHEQPSKASSPMLVSSRLPGILYSAKAEQP
jgi:hypothetical protein